MDLNAVSAVVGDRNAVKQNRNTTAGICGRGHDHAVGVDDLDLDIIEIRRNPAAAARINQHGIKLSGASKERPLIQLSCCGDVSQRWTVETDWTAVGDLRYRSMQNRSAYLHAPPIEMFKIPTDKIREVIGTGGKVIREIVEKTGAKI